MILDTLLKVAATIMAVSYILLRSGKLIIQNMGVPKEWSAAEQVKKMGGLNKDIQVLWIRNDKSKWKEIHEYIVLQIKEVMKQIWQKEGE